MSERKDRRPVVVVTAVENTANAAQGLYDAIIDNANAVADRNTATLLARMDRIEEAQQFIIQQHAELLQLARAQQLESGLHHERLVALERTLGDHVDER